jgi:hypothetical protein
MLSWLDTYIREIGDYLEPAKREMGSKDSLDWKAFQYAVGYLERKPRMIAEIAQGLMGVSRDTMDFFNTLLVMFMGMYYVGDDRETLAIQITPELGADFYGAKAPDAPEALEMIKQHGIVYIDFPSGTYAFGSQYELRAILVVDETHSLERDEDEEETPERIARLKAAYGDRYFRALAVLRKPGARMSDVGLTFTYGGDEETHQTGNFLAELGIDRAVFKGQVEDLIRLSLLYYKSEEGRRETLPYIEPARLERLPRQKQRAKQKQFSIFNIVRLHAPVGRFGRVQTEQAPREGWTLGVRVPVRGHFRWQAYGPGHTLRRLQWIAAHERGPKDAPTKIDLHVLESHRPTP